MLFFLLEVPEYKNHDVLSIEYIVIFSPILVYYQLITQIKLID